MLSDFLPLFLHHCPLIQICWTWSLADREQLLASFVASQAYQSPRLMSRSSTQYCPQCFSSGDGFERQDTCALHCLSKQEAFG